MRAMYDAVDAAAIPADAQMVAGYIDGLYAWSAADWARFPAAVKVRIAVLASTNAGEVLDVETGDATPAQAPGWATMRRAAKCEPTVYCNLSTWPSVQAAFASAGVAPPSYWVALYDGVADVPSGAVAKQFSEGVAGSPYDTSAVVDYWPGVDAPTPTPIQEAPDMQAGIQAHAGGQWLVLVTPEGVRKQAIPTSQDILEGLEKMGAVATSFSDTSMAAFPTIPGIA